MSDSDDRLYKFLRNTALALGALWIAWAFYDSFLAEQTPSTLGLAAAARYFEDRNYEEALNEYREVLKDEPANVSAIRGEARTLVQLGRLDEALERYDEAVARDPGYAGQYANRGILYDRLGRYEDALRDYERALEMDPEIAEGVHWLTRFLRNQPEKPPTIADRASYLRQELAKPESERVLSVPEQDEAQRPYKM